MKSEVNSQKVFEILDPSSEQASNSIEVVSSRE